MLYEVITYFGDFVYRKDQEYSENDCRGNNCQDHQSSELRSVNVLASQRHKEDAPYHQADKSCKPENPKPRGIKFQYKKPYSYNDQEKCCYINIRITSYNVCYTKLLRGSLVVKLS